MSETNSTRCVTFKGQAMVFCVPDARLDMHEAVHNYQEARIPHELVSMLQTVN